VTTGDDGGCGAAAARREGLAVVVPSRGRPAAVRLLAERLHTTSTAATALIVVVDDGDEQAAEYSHMAARGPQLPGLLTVGDTHGPAEALNSAAVQYAPGVSAVMYLPDTVLPVEPGWDARLLAALAAGHGIATGYDDTLRPHARPAHAVVRAEIVQALGYLVPPDLTDPRDWPGLWAQWAAVTGGMAVTDAVFTGNPAVTSGTRRPLPGPGWDAYRGSGRAAADLHLLRQVSAAWRTG
jgi:hypothetical protein